MLGSMLDVTELEEGRAALHERDAKLSRILQAAPEAVIVADHNGRITLFNEGAQEIFGYAPGEIVGRSIVMLMPEESRAHHDAYISDFAAAPDSRKRIGKNGEISGRRKNGEIFPGKATISKLETPDGFTYTVWLRDITASKAIREELIAAKTAAEAASNAKSNFIANMSHELRTPLNAILGFSEIMEMETYGSIGHPRYREYIGDIRRSGTHLLSIVRDILSISELDAGKTQLNEEEILDAGELLNECAKWVEDRAKKAGVRLNVACPLDTPYVRADKRLLTQVVLNLLSNATKFTPEGGSIEVSAQEAEDGSLRFSVRDTGIGMTTDQISRIGEPFLQFDESRSRKFAGTGLGLSIAKRLVERHGGSLNVQSTPNIGTVFFFDLPPERSIREKLDGKRSA